MKKTFINQKTKNAFNNNYIEYESRGENYLTPEDYLNIIRPYSRIMMNNQKALNSIIIKDYLSGERKIQLTMQITFISFLGTVEISKMNIKSDNIEIVIGYETDYIIGKLFKSLKKGYQELLETKMKKSKFAFESADLLCYSLPKISLNGSGSYIGSPSWLKNKIATINPNNKNNV